MFPLFVSVLLLSVTATTLAEVLQPELDLWKTLPNTSEPPFTRDTSDAAQLRVALQSIRVSLSQKVETLRPEWCGPRLLTEAHLSEFKKNVDGLKPSPVTAFIHTEIDKLTTDNVVKLSDVLNEVKDIKVKPILYYCAFLWTHPPVTTATTSTTTFTQRIGEISLDVNIFQEKKMRRLHEETSLITNLLDGKEVQATDLNIRVPKIGFTKITPEGFEAASKLLREDLTSTTIADISAMNNLLPELAAWRKLPNLIQVPVVVSGDTAEQLQSLRVRLSSAVTTMRAELCETAAEKNEREAKKVEVAEVLKTVRTDLEILKTGRLAKMLPMVIRQTELWLKRLEGDEDETQPLGEIQKHILDKELILSFFYCLIVGTHDARFTERIATHVLEVTMSDELVREALVITKLLANDEPGDEELSRIIVKRPMIGIRSPSNERKQRIRELMITDLGQHTIYSIAALDKYIGLYFALETTQKTLASMEVTLTKEAPELVSAVRAAAKSLVESFDQTYLEFGQLATSMRATPRFSYPDGLAERVDFLCDIWDVNYELDHIVTLLTNLDKDEEFVSFANKLVDLEKMLVMGPAGYEPDIIEKANKRVEEAQQTLESAFSKFAEPRQQRILASEDLDAVMKQRLTELVQPIQDDPWVARQVREVTTLFESATPDNFAKNFIIAVVQFKTFTSPLKSHETAQGLQALISKGTCAKSIEDLVIRVIDEIESLKQKPNVDSVRAKVFSDIGTIKARIPEIAQCKDEQQFALHLVHTLQAYAMKNLPVTTVGNKGGSQGTPNRIRGGTIGETMSNPPGKGSQGAKWKKVSTIVAAVVLALGAAGTGAFFIYAKLTK